MRFFKSIRAWWRGLFRKRRFNMLNATDNSEEWHMHLSPASIFAAFLSFVLLLFILVLSLVAYSPILEFLPGYRTEADRSRESLVQNIIRLDSMERMMNDMLTYNENIALIMEGRTPVARVLASSDSSRISKVLVMPSHEDSLLRAQMEGDGEYAIAGCPLQETLQVGDRITAIDNGTVVQSLWTPETGYIVVLQHAGNLISVYKNLSQSLVTTGQTIRSGELIGYNAEVQDGEVRLFEFELWNNGKPVDPEGYIVF